MYRDGLRRRVWQMGQNQAGDAYAGRLRCGDEKHERKG